MNYRVKFSDEASEHWSVFPVAIDSERGAPSRDWRRGHCKPRARTTLRIVGSIHLIMRAYIEQQDDLSTALLVDLQRKHHAAIIAT